MEGEFWHIIPKILKKTEMKNLYDY
ncbi:hypothetical protein Godav_025273 [Gossypium davidsonii]|uniref:Uncharacterized protein n=1 Tax=Gossypium davidsonii TaxID=34287 RepID=A0A7J8T9Q1_GOSDV|nr:hypothetical protein [Gossypium davidsonii]